MKKEDVEMGVIVQRISRKSDIGRNTFVILPLTKQPSKKKKRSPNYLPFGLYSGLWYAHETGGDIYNGNAYGKGGDQLTVGALPDWEVVGRLTEDTKHLLD